MAGECCVSTWHLSSLLNQATGMGRLEIVSTIRTEKAKDLLLSFPELRIQDIAERIGFLDVAHFLRSFKTATGASPKDFRNADA
ncbi:MAG: helix-turn-helix transcriptional regulator [Lachnospiraceae bacterium]|nr:helix-turn-helix transcriptional regulator [Lachnospiraceae bacterium]